MKFDLRFSLVNCYRAFPHIFDGLVLPDTLDKDVFIHVLMRECGSMAITNTIANIAEDIASWSIERKYTIERLSHTLTLEYNPIENYDRIEDSTDNSVSVGESSASNKQEQKSAGFNTEGVKVDHEITDTGNGNSNAKVDNVRHSRIHGNIGVTTSDQMIKSHRETVVYNIYKELATMFANDLLVSIYF